MKTFLKSSLLFLFFLVSMSCQTAQKTKITTPVSPTIQTTELNTPKSEISAIAEVLKLANKSTAELDKIFGKSQETKFIENGGEYRLYKTAN